MQIHLNEEQLAERWNISVRTLQRWRHTGKGPTVLRLGSRIVYPVRDIERYEQEHRSEGKGSATPRGSNP